MLFDTHAHLNLDTFDGKIDTVINEARANEVSAIIVPGVDFRTSKKSIELSQNYDRVYSAIGFHPLEIENLSLTDFNSYWQELIKFLETEEKIIAIGEIGLDKIKSSSNLIKQKEFFQVQLEIAEKFNKPIIVHNRAASVEIIDILKRSTFKQKVIFHCAEPNELILQFALENNYYLGFDGDITYSIEKQNFIKKIPLDLILLETDSPFLTPEPLRSQKIFPNEPKNLKLILNFASQLLNENIQKLEKIIWQNSCQAFGLKFK